MHTVFLSLGANLGSRKQTILKAIKELGLKNAKISKFYETEPIGMAGQPWFLNVAIKGEINLKPTKLLLLTQNIEKTLGRTEKSKNFPRIIDIDILFYDDLVVKMPNLEVPHPRLHLRKFVLIPLAEIAPDFSHPVLKKTIKQLLNDCTDTSIIKPA